MTQKNITYIKTSGMTCGNCEKKIAGKLKTLAGVESVRADYVGGYVRIAHEDTFSRDAALGALFDLGYEGSVTERTKMLLERSLFFFVSGIIMALLIYLNKRTGLLNRIPEIPETASYSLLLVLGVMTSVHCIGMCGGINLSQTGSSRLDEPGRAVFYRGLSYNAGRILSYTLVGALAGALGSVFSLSLPLQATVIAIAGTFMVLAGFHMLGLLGGIRRIIPGKSPFRIFRWKKNGTLKSPFAVGLANGLMPCGPLQSMQIYALSTGSVLQGAFSMFLFSAGTVPLMLLFGSLSAVFSLKSRRVVHRVSGLLIIVLGVGMVLRALSLQGVALPVETSSSAGNGAAVAVLNGESQIVESRVTPYGYEPIVVQKGLPVEWKLTAGPGDITGCNNAIIVREYGIQQPLAEGTTTVEFLPEESGTFLFTCWMGMISSNILVVDDLAAYDPSMPIESPAPASGRDVRIVIPRFETDDIAYVREENGLLKAELRIIGKKISPAITVMKKGVETEWVLFPENLDGGSERILFPAYNAAVDLRTGEESKLKLVPEEDFYFYSSDGESLGFIIVSSDPESLSTQEVLDIVNSYLPSQ